MNNNLLSPSTCKFKGWIILLFLCFTNFLACSSNEDITKVPQQSYEIDYRSTGWGEFPRMINSICDITTTWQFQTQEYLNAGIFSQMYMTASAGKYGDQPNNAQLFMVDRWNVYAAQVPYTTVMPSWFTVSVSAFKYPEFKAIANVLKVAAIHKVVDAFGPAQYVKYGTAKSGVPYDQVDVIYDSMISELSFAVSTIDDYIARHNNISIVAAITGVEGIYKGDLGKWKKLANSLKLRLAMRMSMVAKDKAKRYATEAITSGGISDNTDNALIPIGDNNNPYSIYANSWGEMKMSAMSESILVGYHDPRTSKIFNISKQIANTYKGIRLGGMATSVGGYGNFSTYVAAEKTPIRLFSAAEYQFLLAEARLRDFITSGTAQSYYEKGITLSCDEYGVSASASAYIVDTTSRPIDYVDPINAANSVPATIHVSVAWKDSDADDVKFEKIITQKWIALIPSGAEGWAEYRRTGYPRLFKSALNLTPSSIDNDGPRRLPYTSYHQNNSDDKKELEKAIRIAFGGKDLGNQRLWWDVADKTFKK